MNWWNTRESNPPDAILQGLPPPQRPCPKRKTKLENVDRCSRAFTGLGLGASAEPAVYRHRPEGRAAKTKDQNKKPSAGWSREGLADRSIVLRVWSTRANSFRNRIRYPANFRVASTRARRRGTAATCLISGTADRSAWPRRFALWLWSSSWGAASLTAETGSSTRIFDRSIENCVFGLDGIAIANPDPR